MLKPLLGRRGAVQAGKSLFRRQWATAAAAGRGTERGELDVGRQKERNCLPAPHLTLQPIPSAVVPLAPAVVPPAGTIASRNWSTAPGNCVVLAVVPEYSAVVPLLVLAVELAVVPQQGGAGATSPGVVVPLVCTGSTGTW